MTSGLLGAFVLIVATHAAADCIDGAAQRFGTHSDVLRAIAIVESRARRHNTVAAGDVTLTQELDRSEYDEAKAQKITATDHSRRQIFLMRGVDRLGCNTFENV